MGGGGVLIKPGIPCRIVRLTGYLACANNRFVTVTTHYGDDGHEFVPSIDVGSTPCGFGRMHLYGVPGFNLQPIADPDSCTLTDAQIYRRGPVPTEQPETT